MSIKIFLVILLLSFKTFAADVLIITDQGGHTSAAAQIQQLLDQQNLSYTVVFQGDIRKEPHKGADHNNHLKRFEETPELINKQRDDYYARADVTPTIEELTNEKTYPQYTDKISEIIRTEKPRVIILTAALLELFAKLKRMGVIGETPIVWIPTDYGTQDLWTRLYASVPDIIFSPSRQWTEAAISKGTPKEKILTTGMPAHPLASKSLTRAEIDELWKPLGFSRDIPTILISGGTGGVGGYKPILDSIKAAFVDQKIQIIAATGSHQKNFDLVSEYSKTMPANIKIVPLGFTDKLPLYMRYACDIVVTKAGGLTSTEVALMGKPMIHTIPAVNVERDNVKHFSEEGMSITSTWADMGHTLLHLIKDKELQGTIVGNQRRVTEAYNMHAILEWLAGVFQPVEEPAVHHTGFDPVFCEKGLSHQQLPHLQPN